MFRDHRHFTCFLSLQTFEIHFNYINFSDTKISIEKSEWFSFVRNKMEFNKGSSKDVDENIECLNFETINNDCKQLIFEYLDWKDLVNIAETCKAFHTAVCSVFTRKYSGLKRVALCRNVFCPDDDELREKYVYSFLNNIKISKEKLKFSLLISFCF